MVALLFFYLVIQFFREDTPKHMNVEVERERNQQNEYNELMITYINETEKLKDEIRTLSSLLYETRKALIETDAIIEQLPHPATTEIIHKELGEENYILIYKNEKGYTLLCYTPENPFPVTTRLGYLASDVWNYENGILVGLTVLPIIDMVKVNGGNNEVEMELSEVNDSNIRFWYGKVEFESEQILSESTITVYDKEGNVLREDFVSPYR